MAAYVQALIIEKNNTVFINTDGTIGMLSVVPTPDNVFMNGIPDGDYWAIPINYGFFNGFRYQPYNASNSFENVKPTPSSFPVCRVTQKNNDDWFYINGTMAQYIAGTPPTTLPATLIKNNKALIPVCQKICNTDETGNHIITLALPTLAANERYYPFGFYQGVAFATASASGYATKSDLLNFLNGSWGSISSPAITITWAWADTDQTILRGTVSGITGDSDLFCGSVLNINLSA